MREKSLPPAELMTALTTMLTVPLYPHGTQALGLSKVGIYRLVREGKIPSIQLGSAWRIPTAPLRKMLGIETTDAGKAA